MLAVWIPIVVLSMTFPVARSFGQEPVTAVPPTEAAASADTQGVATLPDVVSPTEKPVDPVFARLMSLWESQRAEVVTADVDYWIYSQIPQGSWSREQFNELIQQFDFVSNPDSLREFVPLIMGRPPLRDPPWGVGRIRVDGQKKRDTMGPFDNLVDGEYEYLADSDNNQLLIFQMGQSRRVIRGLNGLRWLPPHYISPKRYSVEAASDDEVVLVNPTEGSRLTVDARTGMSRHWLNHRDLENLIEEVWQQGFTSHGDGIIVPTVQIQATYHNNLVSGFHVLIIQRAEVNQPVPSAAFQMAVAPGRKVFDYRGRQSTMIPVPEGVEDMRSMLGQPRGPETAPQGSPGTPRFPWGLAINGLVLVVVGLVLWRGTRKQVPSNSVGDSESGGQRT
ncbi:MAG: hypothetical protein R3C01_10250 [Planctomycetaceae bacterium]